MRIAILGWGSLLWEGDPDFDQQHDEWQLDGPTLKIEFSRVSTSRQGALTLVIDNQNGAPMAVAWCLSKRQTVEDAICDLRLREGTTAKNIGYIAASKQPDPKSPTYPIEVWARREDLDAAIWTALESNFKKEAKTVFSVEAAVAYVKNLDACGKAKAGEYVWSARKFVRTPVRTALEKEPWFQKPSTR